MVFTISTLGTASQSNDDTMCAQYRLSKKRKRWTTLVSDFLRAFFIDFREALIKDFLEIYLVLPYQVFHD